MKEATVRRANPSSGESFLCSLLLPEAHMDLMLDDATPLHYVDNLKCFFRLKEFTMPDRPTGCTDEEWQYLQNLHDADAGVRDNAAGALHALWSDHAVPAFLDRLEREPEDGVRGNLVYYLGEFAVEADDEIADQAKTLLKKLQDKESSENVKAEITDLLERLQNRYGSDPETQIGKRILVTVTQISQKTREKKVEQLLGTVSKFANGSMHFERADGGGEHVVRFGGGPRPNDPTEVIKLETTGEEVTGVELVHTLLYYS